MAASLHKQTIPVFVKYLKNMSGLITKAEAFSEAKKVETATLINYRMIEDMRPFIYQVQTCCSMTVMFAERVTKTPHVVVEDNETTVEELKSRIASTIETLEKFDAEKINEAADQELIMDTRAAGAFYFKTAQQYASEFVIPNFHFHLTTGYCLLRQQGVDIGAMDYLKDVFTKHEA